MCSNLDFPIDCPVCKLDNPESEDEEEAPEPASQQLQTQTPLDRTCSDIVSSRLDIDAVDPDHGMQLHASHSTPSLETATLPLDTMASSAQAEYQDGMSRVQHSFSARVQPDGFNPTGFAVDDGGLKSWLTPSIDIHARSAQHESPQMSSATQPHDSGQAMSSQHGDSSPSFPIIASETPITPSLIPTERIVHQDSRALFSPHELTQSLSPEATQNSSPELPHRPLSQSHRKLNLSRSSLSAACNKDTDAHRPTNAQTAGVLAPEELSLRSMSLGEPLN